ncbi:MAG: hypothetical protein AB3X38_13510, partial [Leptothrix ochracea]|uniref:hypothetical protein n=1 Tax=Leptothrix ochracea TaxID=735331 RepID=UPI0034E2192A
MALWATRTVAGTGVVTAVTPATVSGTTATATRGTVERAATDLDRLSTLTVGDFKPGHGFSR